MLHGRFRPLGRKLNTYTTFCDGRCGGGGVFRNSGGFVCGCFIVLFRAFSAFKAKLSTTVYALELAEKIGWDSIWLEFDSFSVVHLFRS